MRVNSLEVGFVGWFVALVRGLLVVGDGGLDVDFFLAARRVKTVVLVLVVLRVVLVVDGTLVVFVGSGRLFFFGDRQAGRVLNQSGLLLLLLGWLVFGSSCV